MQNRYAVFTQYGGIHVWDRWNSSFTYDYNGNIITYASESDARFDADERERFHRARVETLRGRHIDVVEKADA